MIVARPRVSASPGTTPCAEKNRALPEADRAQLVINLGSRAFSDPGFTTADKGNVGPVPNNVMELLNKALDITKEAAKRSPS